jgi:hypothetical protein
MINRDEVATQGNGATLKRLRGCRAGICGWLNGRSISLGVVLGVFLRCARGIAFRDIFGVFDI